MDIILKTDIEKLGFKDDMVSVKSGYARNFLVPQGKAIIATSSIKKMHEETLRQRSHKEEKLKEEAEKSVEKLKSEKITVGAKVGESGKKIFGSVNTIQIAEALNNEGYNIDKRNIKILGDAIKEVGTYQAEIKLYKDISATIDFEVVAE